MAASGHTMAQTAQPVHPPPLLKKTGEKPLAFNWPDGEITSLGQNAMQISQPLHLSWSISMYPFDLAFESSGQSSFVRTTVCACLCVAMLVSIVNQVCRVLHNSMPKSAIVQAWRVSAPG